MILLHCVVALMFLNCVRTTKDIGDYVLAIEVPEFDKNNYYSFRPSVHNAVRKQRQVQPSSVLSEGGGTVEVKALPVMNTTLYLTDNNVPGKIDKQVSAKNHTPASVAPSLNAVANSSLDDMKPTPTALDLNPGVVKRGAIVFGGFLLLAVAYYVFYRKKNTKSETNNLGTNDNNQFRYGVLHSEDRRDNMELSQIPLTMESDEDDDEDLEIFDLGQKKKSLSYVNLQPNDEDLVFSSTSREIDTDNLLLDIEDSNGSETLINWTNNGGKSTS